MYTLNFVALVVIASNTRCNIDLAATAEALNVLILVAALAVVKAAGLVTAGVEPIRNLGVRLTVELL